MKKIELFVPGRLCLFGEHSDWAGRFTDMNSSIIPGYAIVTGIDLGIYANACKGDTFKISSINEKGERLSFECEMDYNVLREKAQENQYFCYACGVAAYILENYKIGGIDIDIEKVTLPIKKGLSSSAAICVLVTRAFNQLYNLRMSVNGEMQAAYRGEMLTKSRCGRLDQACAYGINPVCMEFSGDNISVDKLKVGKSLYWVFADLNAHKDTKKILSSLNKAYPYPQTEVDEKIQQALGEDNKEIIGEAVKAIADGDAERVGQLMVTAQKIFDEKIMPGCPEELTAPKLHSVLNNERVKELSYGGKGVGSQGDGTVQFIAKDKTAQDELVDYLNSIGLTAYAFVVPSGNRVTKAIIPVAGFGTRMYPETRFVKKELLPVITPEGVVKPVIMCLLEELDQAGIEEIVLIVAKEDEAQLKDIFEKPLDDEYMSKLPNHVMEYEKLIAKIGKKLRYVVQEERRGFGHAVFQAKKYIGKEPALLMLGDFVYKSNTDISCTMQTIKAHRRSGGKLTISIKPVALEEVVHYGILTGTFDDKYKSMMNVTEMAEKPSVQYAKDYLGTRTGLGEEKYYCTFGQYVLSPEVFDYLEADIKAHDASGDPSEIQLTTALCKAMESSGMVGIAVDGSSYDVGIPSAYLKTINEFSKQ